MKQSRYGVGREPRPGIKFCESDDHNSFARY